MPPLFSLRNYSSAGRPGSAAAMPTVSLRRGYQTNLLILGAVGYKFSDFMRVGIPLSLVLWLGFSIVLPLLYLT